MMTIPTDIIMRIDRVGSFRLILSDEVILSGPSGREEQSVIKIMAPLSSNHARIRRHSQGYSIEPLRGSVQLGLADNHSTNSQAPLLMEETYWSSNMQAVLAPEIKLNLKIVSALSQSATLNISPENRLVDRVDGIVLMENMILLGPANNMHIPCPHWEQSAALIFRNDAFRFCTSTQLLGDNFRADKQSTNKNQTIDETIKLNQHYDFDEFGFYLEG